MTVCQFLHVRISKSLSPINISRSSLAASPADSPRKVAKDGQHDSNSTLIHSPPSPKVPLDTITLSAANASAACQCAAVPGVATTTLLKETAIGQTTTTTSDVLLPTVSSKSAHHHSSGKRSVDMQLISHQISELAHRVDNLETTMKADIRTILEILQNQQQGGSGGAGGRAALKCSQSAGERQNASTFQPSDSDYSFDMGGSGSGEDKLQSAPHPSSAAAVAGTSGGGNGGGGATLKLTPTSGPHKRTGNVQRSISQPECANERNLFA